MTSSSRARSSRTRTRRPADADPDAPSAPRLDPEGETPAERSDWGRSLRARVPRSAWSAWEPAAHRPDPVALLLGQSAQRVPELVPIRHGRMLVSPFTFYRGAALVMAADLARIPSSGIYVQACGDAHLSNFGAFATPERSMAFDVNDFDESHPAPFEWDLARLAASIVIAADSAGLDRKTSKVIAAHAARRYREQMRALSGQTFLDVWYSKVDFEARVQEAEATYTRSQLATASKAVRKARRKTNAGALDRLAERIDDRWRIREDPPLIVRADIGPEEQERLRDFFEQYLHSLSDDLLPLVRHYKVVDFARKVVGVGSVGTEAHIALLIGSRGDDALFLQMKEAPDSVLERYTVSGLFEHQGQRVVFGQRLMQASSDMFLGWASAPASAHRRMDFYVRQLNDYKGSADVSGMDERRLSMYVEVCAEALARAHARSGSASAIAGYLGKGSAFDKAIGEFSVAYANQNRLDYEAFAAAAADGRMEVRSGV